ncbi:ribonuclease HII [Lysobacter sp. ESA13C]|uniref:ribonuclease HII n=1 Tax=Lysobacter sp. ESA13C TaxID=2862676 RepID=UPI001CBB0008|nr:ribonuclease HII [Lysobacter sp. ESA13C]
MLLHESLAVTTESLDLADTAVVASEPLRARAKPRLIAGVDEAGRGPLAGPVSVAAVILNPRRRIDGLDDSKKLSEARREALYPLILERALAWRIEFVEVEEIDRINIFQATMTGMRRAVIGLAPVADLVRVDGNHLPQGLPCRGEALIGGDATEPAIMAASILAKVARDRMMRSLHERYPQYGFDQHKGYSTAAHLAALSAHGPCPHHRRSFAPVRTAYENLSLF